MRTPATVLLLLLSVTALSEGALDSSVPSLDMHATFTSASVMLGEPVWIGVSIHNASDVPVAIARSGRRNRGASRSQDRTYAPLMFALLDDANPDVRRAAIFGIGTPLDGGFAASDWPLFVSTNHDLPHVSYLRSPRELRDAWRRWWRAHRSTARIYDEFTCAIARNVRPLTNSL